MTMPKVVKELLERSNFLGSNPKFTNYAGGNTSAKGLITNPATGEETTVLWVKGSGGDLGTMTESGLAALVQEKFVALKKVYRGVEHEDEMVALLERLTNINTGTLNKAGVTEVISLLNTELLQLGFDSRSLAGDVIDMPSCPGSEYTLDVADHLLATKAGAMIGVAN